MRTNLRMDPQLLPKPIGNRCILMANHEIEQSLVQVLAAVNAITTTAITGSFFHSRAIGDNYLLEFLSRKDVRVALLLRSMIDADRTSFGIQWDRKDDRIILWISVTSEKEVVWSVKLRFGRLDGHLTQYEFLDEKKKR